MKPTTIIVLSVALVVCVLFAVFKYADPFASEDDRPQALWTVDAEDVVEIRITDDEGDVMAFARADGAWRLREPLDAPADQQRIDQLCRAFAELGYVQAADGDVATDVMGLDQPRWTVELLTDEKQYGLQIGRQVQEVGGQGAVTYVRQTGRDNATVYAVALDVRRLLQHPVSDFRDRQVFAFSPQDIAQIVIEGRNTYQLYQANGRWRIKADRFDALADPQIVMGLLSACAFVQAEDFADASEDPDADLERFNLTDAKRQLAVTLTTQDQATFSLILGRAVGDLVYAKRGDSAAVILASAQLLTHLQPSPEQLRDRHVVLFTPREIFQIELGDLDPPVELIRSRGAWQMLAPLSRPANDEATEGLLTALTQLQATGFHDEPVDEDMFALDRPTATITLHATGRGQDAGPIVVRLTQGVEDRPSFMRVGDAGPVFELPAGATRFMLAETMTYCGTTLFGLPAETPIERLGIHRRDGSHVLQPAGDGWEFADGRGPANADVVEQIVSRLRDLRAERIVAIASNAPAALRQAPRDDTIRVNIVTDAEDGSVIQLVRVDREEFSGVYGWQPTAQPILVGRFDGALFDQLSADLRDLRVWSVAWRDVTRFSIQHGGADPIVMVKDADQWAIDGQPDVRIDQGEVETFLIAARRLSVTRYLPETAGRYQQFGLANAWLTIELETPERTYRLGVSRIGPDEFQNRYALTDGQGDVFVMSADVVGELAVQRDQFLAE